MLGYFILKEEAEKLELLKNPGIKKKLQQTYFVVTDRDIKQLIKPKISSAKFNNISNFLNKNYFENIVELIVHFIQNK